MKKIILPALALLGAYMPAAADDVMQIYKADGSVIDIPVGDVSRVTFLEDENAALIFEDDFDQESRIPNEAVWELCPQSTPAWTRHLSNSYDEAYVEDGKLVLLAHVVDGKARCGGIQMKGSSLQVWSRRGIRPLHSDGSGYMARDMDDAFVTHLVRMASVWRDRHHGASQHRWKCVERYPR